MKTTHGMSGKEECSCKLKEKRQIVFTARPSHSVQNLPNNAVVKFDKVVVNEGKAYNPTTGIFTCPEDGLYNFSWTILTRSGSRFNSVLVVDGTAIVYNHNEADSIKNPKSSSQTAGVKLQKGNKVWIRAETTSGKFAYEVWSSFTGHRI